MNKIKEFANDQGYNRIELSVCNDNKIAIDFYKKMGFIYFSQYIISLLNYTRLKNHRNILPGVAEIFIQGIQRQRPSVKRP